MHPCVDTPCQRAPRPETVGRTFPTEAEHRRSANRAEPPNLACDSRSDGLRLPSVRCLELSARSRVVAPQTKEEVMGFGRGLLLWLLGIPLPIIIVLALFMHH